jgi:thiol-disulfide isomerase/thioredoxin
MKKIKSLLLFALPIVAIIYACNGQSGHAIKGTITGASNLQVQLEQAHFDRTNTALGKATCDANGNFEIKQEKPYEQGLYRLSIGAKRLFIVLDGKEKTVEIKGNLEKIDRYDGLEIKGSETFSCYAGILKDLFSKQLSSFDEARTYIKRGCNPFMQAILTSTLLGNNAEEAIEDFKTAAKALNDYMPGSKYATDYNNMVTQLQNQIAQQQAAETIKVGMPAPEISLPGPDGKVRSLSSLKGKVVLLDFWASWCGPCRRANPHVVEVYNKYKDKGFDVFSVSLDKPDGKDKWVEAIKKDGLVWDNHVSDLQFWNSAPAATYGVRGIPKTFLIGRDGKILAIDPRNTLEQELLKVL